MANLVTFFLFFYFFLHTIQKYNIMYNSINIFILITGLAPMPIFRCHGTGLGVLAPEKIKNPVPQRIFFFLYLYKILLSVMNI